MTLPRDPYEVATRQKLDALDGEVSKQRDLLDAVERDFEARKAGIEDELARLDELAEAHRLVLKHHSADPSPLEPVNPFADDARIGRLLRGKTQVGSLLTLAGLNDGHLRARDAEYILRRHGKFHGNPKWITRSIYNLFGSHPEHFVKVAPGEWALRQRANGSAPVLDPLQAVLSPS